MKIRNGFVSNSSSSSFMIGIGVVNNWVKFTKWYDSIKDDILYPSTLQLVDPKLSFDISRSKDGWDVEAPVNDATVVHLSQVSLNDVDSNIPSDIIAKNLLTGEGEKNVVVLSFGNDEGDSAFTTDGDEYEVSYDIDLDWFSEEQQKLYTGFSSKNGIAHVDKMFGAGRNG